ncbi:MAG: DUF58 domain-containing protein [Oscillospiraceae bacterium]|nr:DUF58 domain-containing protein [Oscillospiraceae bacterium]
MKKENELVQKLSSVFGYLLAMVLCVYFALYMSAPAGWTIFYILAAAPLFSLVLLAVVKFTDCLEITASADSAMVYKNEDFYYKIKIRNKSILPVPIIIIRMKTCEGIRSENGFKPFSVSVYTKGTAEFKIKYTASMWGSAPIGIDSVYISDFLNLVSLPLFRDKDFTSVIKVFPDIPDIPSDSPLIKTAAETIRFSDECEDTKESDSFNFFGGMPGYTHREYVEGDPVKRINWKLSLKRDSYMVRLDDEVEAMQQVIVLDSRWGSRAENERAVEGVLSVVFSLFRLGFDSIVFYNTPHGFTCAEISEYGDISALQTAFADYSFSHSPSVRLPVEELTQKKLSGIMFCTPCSDKMILNEIAGAAEYGISVIPVTAAETAFFESPYWKLNSDYTAECC